MKNFQIHIQNFDKVQKFGAGRTNRSGGQERLVKTDRVVPNTYVNNAVDMVSFMHNMGSQFDIIKKTPEQALYREKLKKIIQNDIKNKRICITPVHKTKMGKHQGNTTIARPYRHSYMAVGKSSNHKANLAKR